MQQFWWRDLRDLEDKWVGLSIEVNRPKSSKPPLHLQSGNNGRMKLMLNESPLFWATIATSYYGAWLVRNPRPVQLESPSVPPIVSADVQEHFELPVQERFPRWCRYFINQLMNNQADFLYPGHWVARPLLPAVSRYKPVAGPDGWIFPPRPRRPAICPTGTRAGRAFSTTCNRTPCIGLIGIWGT